AVGDLIYYDPLLLKKALCRKCGQKVGKALAEVVPASEAQIIVDRLRAIDSLPCKSKEMEEEFETLKERLIADYLHDPAARNFLFAEVCLPGRSAAAKVITASRPGKCLACASEQLPGATVLWDPDAHKILCAECALRQSPALD